MKRSLVLAAALFLFALALAFSSLYTSRVVKASPPPDKCLRCLEKVQRDYERCEARLGGPNNICDDEFNQGIIHCYATVCEQ